MELNHLARGTNKIIAELRARHGEKALKLDDIAPEDRDLVKSVVGDAATFTVEQVAAGLVDAYEAVRKEDGRGWFRDGKNDGVVQPDELEKAQQRNPAASPLYTRIAQRTESFTRLSGEVQTAREEAWRAHHHVLTGPEYHKVLNDAVAPFKNMPARDAYRTAMATYEKTGATHVAAEVEKAWAPIPAALDELKEATTAYTHEEKAARADGLRTAIQTAKDRIVDLREANKKMAAEYGPTYIHHHDYTIRDLNASIHSSTALLEETQSRPSIPKAERDQRQAAAQKKVDDLVAHLQFIIEDTALGLLSFAPDVVSTERAAALREEANVKLRALETEREKNRI